MQSFEQLVESPIVQSLLMPVVALNRPFLLTESHQSMKNVASEQTPVFDMTVTASSISNPHSFTNIMFKRQGFRIGDLNLMIAYEDGSEISELPTVYPVPNAPDWFLGFCNLHGHLIPVFDLKRYLNVDDEQGVNHQEVDNVPSNDLGIVSGAVYSSGFKKKPMLFVIGHDDNATGIIIESLLERLEISESGLQADTSLAPEAIEDSVRGCYLVEEALWFDLDVDKFLDSIETLMESS